MKNGIKAQVAGTFEALVGSTAAGESEAKRYFIIPENNAFIRVDVALWKYRMRDKALTENNDTVISYVLCKSMANHTKLTADKLMNIVSEPLNGVTSFNSTSVVNVDEYLKEVKAVWNKLKEEGIKT